MSVCPKALIIDDDPVTRALLSSFVKGVGLSVETANDGPSGLELIERNPSSLVLLDWVMPGMSGLEVCAAVRSRGLPERPYIIVTSGKTAEELKPALLSGADDLLSKPFNRADVVSRVIVGRFVLDGHSQRSLTEAVAEAMAAAAGEVVVRQGSTLARLAFRRGRLVWATVSPQRQKLSDHLVATLGVGEDECRAVLDECRATGKPFDELLVSWRLASADKVGDSLRAWLTAQLERVRALEQPSVLFAPLSPGAMTLEGVDIEEVAPWLVAPPVVSTKVSLPPPGPADNWPEEAVSRAMDIAGAQAAFVLSPRDGTCLASRGSPEHLEVGWVLERTLQALPSWGKDPHLEVLLSSSAHHYVGHVLGHESRLLLVLVTKTKGTMLGRVRLELSKLCASPEG